MHVITIVSLICIIVFGTAASLKKEEKLMEEIKKCYKAAKTLQNDPGDDKKTKEFLNNCEKFLKDIKLSEVQIAALGKIGYNVDNLFNEKGFTLDSEDEKGKDDTEKLNQSSQSTKISQEPPSNKEKVTGDDANNVIPEKSQIPDKEETTISSEIEDNSQDQPKDSQRKGSTAENIDTDPEEKSEKQQQTADQQNVEIPSKPQDVPMTAGETFNYPAGDGSFNQPPVFHPRADAIVQENKIPEAMEFNQNFQAAPFQQAWPQVNPAIPIQPVIHNAQQQQQGVPIQEIMNDIAWNQQAAQIQFQQQQQQQQAFPNPQFFNQPLDGVHNQPGNIPINNFQGNAFYGNPQQPQQHVPFNPMPDNFRGQGQGGFIPQVNTQPERQAWGGGGGGFDYGQAQQQNFYAPNEPQNQNDQQQFYGNNYQRVEL